LEIVRGYDVAEKVPVIISAGAAAVAVHALQNVFFARWIGEAEE